jgi:hypothetical protein
MNTYDYKEVSFRELRNRDDQFDIEKLNKLGLEGWELVCVISGQCIFKKLVKRRVVNRL